MFKITLLVVEAKEEYAQLLSINLEAIDNLKFDMAYAASLQEAAQMLTQKAFDLIFLDLDLPDGYGLDTVKKIVELSNKSAIVIMHDIYNAEVASQAIQLGAQDFIVKNETTSLVLQQMISNALQRNKIKTDLLKTQETFHAIVQTANDAIITTGSDPNGT